jgi:4a-hydroxytetrahydrobiopterin dehydratase
MNDYANRHCVRIAAGSPPMARAAVESACAELADWTCSSTGDAISRQFRFKNFHETMAFVNAVAWIAHREDHHPDLDVHYNHCTVRYSTHAAKGLTENDFICAARIDQLFK